MDRKYSDPTRYENSIDADDSPYGADGGYTRHGNFIPADAMRELVSLREITERQAAEIERLNRDRQLQAKLLLAAHKMLMAAGLGPSSKDYLDQWAFIRDAEIERLLANAERYREALEDIASHCIYPAGVAHTALKAGKARGE